MQTFLRSCDSHGGCMAACLLMIAWMLTAGVGGCDTGGLGQNGGNGNGQTPDDGSGDDGPGDNGSDDQPGDDVPGDDPPPDDNGDDTPPDDDPPPDDTPDDDPPEDTGLPPEAPRQAFQSQCAQNVLNCTTSWPEAVLSVIPGEGQQVINTSEGFVITGSDGNGFEDVLLIGDQSTMGDGANELLYSWSSGAIDANPCTLGPGPEFSTDPNPVVRLASGRHYIRLTVTNDVIQNELSQECGVLLNNEPGFDFEEVEIVVLD